MKYVILKKINNTWYATRNRYTAKELETIVNKHYNDVIVSTTRYIYNSGYIFYCYYFVLILDVLT